MINGAKGQRELQALNDVFDAMHCIAANETTFVNAGTLGYKAARKGHTLSAVDHLVAQIAIENDLTPMTYDEHFRVIAKLSPLVLPT